MRKGFVALLLAVLAFGPAGAPALAFNQPPLNLGLTDILDAPPGPGTYFTEYIQAYQSDTLKDKDGNDIPGDPEIATVLSMNQLVHVYPHKILGGHIGADVLLPIVAISTSGQLPTGELPPAPAFVPFNANPAVLGDLIVGPFLQWFDTKLLGRPFLQRFELDFVLPTGQYDKKYVANPGSNLWTIEPHYAFVWFLTPQLSTSWRLMYDYSTENDDTKVKPGQVFHLNYSVEYELFKNFRGAVTGYYLTQITEDETNGVKGNGTKEQVFAIGPAVFWGASPNFFLGLKTQWESSAENRPEGNRTTFRLTYKF